MFYWSPYHPYIPLMSLNGLPTDYYYPSTTPEWQFAPMPSNTISDSVMQYFDHSESKADMKTEISMLKVEETEREEERNTG